MAFIQPIMAQNQSAPTTQSPTNPESRSAFFSQRSRRQLGLFFAGAGFFAISSVVTRRSLVRRYKASIPKFYQPSNRPGFEVNGAMEAFEALNIATINVVSLGIMATGGLLWAFDISSLDDMRRKVRTNWGVAASRDDLEIEEELQEWFAGVLERKEFKHLKGAEKPKSKETKDEEVEKS